LQYRRWLGVEDGFFDHATIYANDTQVWTNLNSNQGDTSNTQHIDREWRFHDVDLTAQVKDNKVQVKYELASDGGLDFGGWTLDAFCIRGKRPGAPQPTCGDSKVDTGEACDSGSANSNTTADACRTDCTRARCGDGVIDSNETCDDKNVEDGDGCSATCATEDANPGTGGSAGTSSAAPATNGVKDDSGCGCRVPGPSSSDRSASLAALGVALAGLAARARRRR
jgi:MYXO-CTERM domain-containing protein